MDGRGHGPKESAKNPTPSQELGGSKPLGKKLGLLGGAQEEVPPGPIATLSPTLSTGPKAWDPERPYSSLGCVTLGGFYSSLGPTTHYRKWL